MEAVATRANPREGLRATLLCSIGVCIVAGVYLVVRYGSIINGLLFAYVAFMNYQVLQSLGYRRW